MPDKTVPQLLSFNAVVMNTLYLPLIYFFATHGQQIVILGLFMGLDFLFGIAKSIKLSIRIESSIAMRGLMGKCLTMLIPFLLFFFAKGVGDFDKQLEFILPYMFSVFISVEMYSILGNFYTFRTGKVLQDIDLISYIFLGLRRKIVQAIKGLLQ